MSITSIQYGQGVFAPAHQQADTARAEQSQGRSQVDTVSISEEALTRANELQQTAGKDATTERGYPLEAYSVPDWYVDLTGEYTILTASIGDSWEESRTGYEKLNKADQQLFDEYTSILHGHYRDAKSEFGISTNIGDYYHNFLQNEATQDAVRQSLFDRLQNDSRAMKLMQYFGISM